MSSGGKHIVNVAVLSLCVCLLWTACGCRQGQGPGSPLIGITSVYEPTDGTFGKTTVSFAYVSAVAANGGVPLVLPTVNDEQAIERYLEILDGLVLIGGADIPPAAYGEQPHETVVPLTPQRYEFERKLIARWLESGKPLLGVCLGMQFTNVVAGGTMVQDIPSEVGTQVNHKGYHRVELAPSGLLARLLDGDEASVLSSHHQAVDDLGEGLRGIARSADGLVEALERTDGTFGLFVQWHPEQMSDRAHRDAIYGALIRAAAARQ